MTGRAWIDVSAKPGDPRFAAGVSVYELRLNGHEVGGIQGPLSRKERKFNPVSRRHEDVDVFYWHSYCLLHDTLKAPTAQFSSEKEARAFVEGNLDRILGWITA